jgi:hypothetical protein
MLRPSRRSGQRTDVLVVLLNIDRRSIATERGVNHQVLSTFEFILFPDNSYNFRDWLELKIRTICL